MCCTHGKCVKSVVLLQLPDTSETEDLFTGPDREKLRCSLGQKVEWVQTKTSPEVVQNL